VEQSSRCFVSFFTQADFYAAWDGPDAANPHLAFCSDSGLEGGMVRSAEDPAKKVMRKKAKQDRPSEKSVGDALRGIYEKAVREKVPDDLLDLLSKLD